MTAEIIPLRPGKPSALLYDFPRSRIVRYTAPRAQLSDEDRLLALSKYIAEELDKAPPRKRPRSIKTEEPT